MKRSSFARLAVAAAMLAACSSALEAGSDPVGLPDAGVAPPDEAGADVVIGETDGGARDGDTDGEAGSDASAADADASSRLVFFDDFNRASLDINQHGWRLPTLDEDHPDAGSFLYSIDNDWLHITGDTQAPGSSALLSLTSVKNGRGSYEQQRTTPLTEDHYTDLVFRYDPANKDGTFYRARLHEYVEQGGMDRGEVVELALYRIVRADDQLGHLMNNRGHYWENPLIGDAGSPGTGNDAGVQSADVVGYVYPPGPLEDTPDNQCLPSEGHPSGMLPPGDPGCPTVAVPASSIMDRYRLEVTAQGNVITFKLYGYKQSVSGERMLLADKITDTTTDAILGTGLWGVAHFQGDSYVDDFKLESLDP